MKLAKFQTSRILCLTPVDDIITRTSRYSARETVHAHKHYREPIAAYYERAHAPSTHFMERKGCAVTTQRPGACAE